MCDDHPPVGVGTGLSTAVGRRTVLAGATATAMTVGLARPVTAAGPGAAGGGPLQARRVAPGLDIVPRADWGGDLQPTGPLEAEKPEDVRFLLVHHTASANEYPPEGAVAQIRDFFGFHTGEKGWPDLVYNFFVDRYGTVYEARTGSIEQPIKGDATGGSQGFALLCCFVGDFTAVAPTPDAQQSMVRLLGWLAEKYGIDTTPGATASFESRGSNLHPPGTPVTTPTISGHRDMSQTVCPGDTLYPIVRNDFQRLVTNRRRQVAAPATTAPTTPSTTAVPTTSVPPTTTRSLAAPPAESDGDLVTDVAKYGLAGGLALALGGGIMALRGRRREAAGNDEWSDLRRPE